ncbi:MAG: DUF4112 domain-containing protein [Planctomycetaceae bacterium]
MSTTVVTTPVGSSDSHTDLIDRLQKLERLGDWLDRSIRIPGTGYRIGWDTIIGLIPGVGDIATTAISAWIIREARQLGVSRFTLARMIANTGVDTVFGAVPLIGDVFDAAFKSNLRNIEILKKALRKRGHALPQ